RFSHFHTKRPFPAAPSAPAGAEAGLGAAESHALPQRHRDRADARPTRRHRAEFRRVLGEAPPAVDELPSAAPLRGLLPE
ncbi:Protein CGEF-1 b, partial [Aphelenchoides avenae]